MQTYEISLAEALRSPLTSIAELREIATEAKAEHPEVAHVAEQEIQRRERVAQLPSRS